MTRPTRQQTFAAFRQLADINAGRLRGQSVARGHAVMIAAGTLDDEAAAILHASLYPKPGITLGADRIVYVASCDGTPVAWVTRTAHVVLPAGSLSAYQKRQQTFAADAFAQLTRRAIRMLAALADAETDRMGLEVPAGASSTRVLVADRADPTVATWTAINADPVASREHLRTVTGADQDVLIIEVIGYGHYGRHVDEVDLEVLCALEAIADSADVPVTLVGDWLHQEGGSSTRVPAEALPAAFADAYAGMFPRWKAYAAVEREARGWTTVLTEAGIPLELFDLDAFADQLRQHARYGLPVDGRGIAVFRRPTTSGKD
ncbi:hypothetical protein [Actinoplanes sp. RD1]|uniref:hypothetical protein n=1 Tax=Actinoplanes sp. RD1 TaxID=3064538 RepID=UPI002741BC58|nr:hypothetical protein [Actinoplanes sp. RD1]